MNYDDLKRLINKMTKVQRGTEVVVFEEGTNRFIWPASVCNINTSRPFLEGVADEGDRDVQFFDPKRAKGTRNLEIEGIEGRPTELDSSNAGTRPDRVHAAKPTGLDASVWTRGRAAAKKRGGRRKK